MSQAPNLGPALLKRRLGEQLRRLRVAADVTVPQTATELGSSEAKVRHMENGRNVPSKPDLTVMMSLYGATSDEHAELEELRQAAGHRGWWSSYRLPTWLHNYVGMEADATYIRNFEMELIPGLLQTAAYAAEVHNVGFRVSEPKEIEHKVSARLKRQERLRSNPPLELHTVISEAALHRLRGSAHAAEQYRHLQTMVELPNVTIQILPFEKGLHRSMSGSFVLLTFPSDVAAPVGYFEYLSGGQLEHDPRIVALLSDVYKELSESSLTPEDSTEFIGRWL